jgi:hypothetical protein
MSVIERKVTDEQRAADRDALAGMWEMACVFDFLQVGLDWRALVLRFIQIRTFITAYSLMAYSLIAYSLEDY